MSLRIECQDAFVLHAKPFRDTSLLVDFFTREYGKITAVARGARTQRSKFRGVLQAFIPLSISWSGKSELVTLTSAEPNGAPCDFNGKALISALYVNELMQRLLMKHDAHSELYSWYQNMLHALQQTSNDISCVLREFEKQLLVELGYGFDWTHAADLNTAIEPEQWYLFIPDEGFVSSTNKRSQFLAFQGAHILAIANNDWRDKVVMRTAKQILRAAIQPHLQGRPIKSRELFI